MPDLFFSILAISVLILGFGFVVFFHELGHFLAAKWVGIRVEQFAVGFGHAILSWRKGMGVVRGASWKKMEEMKKQGIDTSSFGETEYRLNWIPLGGYVKMLGQDDMDPTAQSEDPRSYNRKSIPARMFVVSAGVIMNVILAFLLFVGLFLMGFDTPPAVVGSLQTNSPGQKAGLQVGDEIKTLDGTVQHDFTKLILNVALARGGEPIPMTIERAGQPMDLSIRPARPAADGKAVYAIGVGPISELRGADAALRDKVKKSDGSGFDPATEILPGDVIVAVNGVDLTPADRTGIEQRIAEYAKFDREIQKSDGSILLTVRGADGKARQVKPRLSFEPFFGETPVSLAGLQPRPVITAATTESPLHGKLHEGDVVTAVYLNGESQASPTLDQLMRRIFDGGKAEAKISLEVLRDGKPVKTEAVDAVRIGQGRWGLAVALDLETDKPVVAGTVDKSAAAKAGIPRSSLVQKVNDVEVKNWFAVHRAMANADGDVKLTYVRLDPNGNPSGEPATATLAISPEERQTLKNTRYGHRLALRELTRDRRTTNPITAAGWGVIETRDLLLQFYVTLRRVAQGEVSVSNFMGPIGIVHSGTWFATKGWDWLVWFLAMISANLAVVNFLPIPIVDGGLFVFLIVEKIKGRPLSARTQMVAQYVGLAIILSVFLLVTYQDIQRLFF